MLESGSGHKLAIDVDCRCSGVQFPSAQVEDSYGEEFRGGTNREAVELGRYFDEQLDLQFRKSS